MIGRDLLDYDKYQTVGKGGQFLICNVLYNLDNPKHSGKRELKYFHIGFSSIRFNVHYTEKLGHKYP